MFEGCDKKVESHDNVVWSEICGLLQCRQWRCRDSEGQKFASRKRIVACPLPSSDLQKCTVINLDVLLYCTVYSSLFSGYCRMILNESADWSRGEINVRPDMIKHFWTPDIIIHDLIRYSALPPFRFQYP